MQLTINRKSLTSLGALVLKHRPDIAQEFIQLIPQDEHKDLSLISHYFDDFCHITSTVKETFLWEKHNYTNVEIKRQFVGVILMFYHPRALTNSNCIFKAQYGLINAIANTLAMNNGNTYRMVKSVLVRLKAYPEFREIVEKFHSQINSKYGSA